MEKRGFLFLKELVLIGIIFLFIQNCAQAAPKIYCKDPAYNFVKIKAGKKIDVIFKIENPGNEILKITDIKKSCDCAAFNVESFPLEIAPHKSFNLLVRFDSSGKFGKQNLLIAVFSNDPGCNILNLNIIGWVDGPAPKRLKPDEKDRALDYAHINMGMMPEGKIEDIPPQERMVFVNYFYSDNCNECSKVEDKIIKPFEEKLTALKNIQIRRYNLSEKPSYLKLAELENLYGLKTNKTPVIFFGAYFMQGRPAIEKHFNETAGYYLSDPYRFIKETPKKNGLSAAPAGPGNNIIVERFEKIKFLTVFLAGLIDGFNPCAFAAFVFFLSFLFANKYGKNAIIKIGLVFIAVSFFTYTLIGCGIFTIIKKLAFFKHLSIILSFCAAAFAFIIALVNIRDFIVYEKGKKSKDVLLKLSPKTTSKIHEIIRNNFKNAGENLQKLTLWKLLSITAVSSFLVTLLESACTGQMYLPALVFIEKVSAYKLKAFLYICAYNLAFILPIITVFLICLAGLSLQKVLNFEKKYFGPVKIFTAAVFLLLSIIIILIAFV